VVAAPSSTASEPFATERPWAPVSARGIYGRGFDRDATASRADKTPPTTGTWSRVGSAWMGGVEREPRHLAGELYDGRIAQDSGGDIAVTGRNVIAKWSRTLSERSSLTAQL